MQAETEQAPNTMQENEKHDREKKANEISWQCLGGTPGHRHRLSLETGKW